MFVKCKIKTFLEVPVEFILNVESIVTIQKIADENKVNLHMNAGDYEFLLENEDVKNEVYEAFVELLATKLPVVSDNVSFLILL